MRIVFIGTVRFSYLTLRHLIAKGAQIVGACTSSGSHLNSDYSDLSSICASHNIPCLHVDDINSEYALSWIRKCRPDIAFCFGWSRLVGRELLNIPPRGVVGYHPAALPANRGRHPLTWAIVLGLKRTASTFFFMDDGADSGDILSQREIMIDDEDDVANLYEKAVAVAISQLDQFVPALAAGTNERIPQDHSRSNIWRKRGAADGRIDWRMSASSIHNLVRGLSHPYIGAEFLFRGHTIKVWKSAVLDVGNVNCEPGKILDMNFGEPIVKCGEQSIRLIDVEPKLSASVGEYL